MNSTNTLTVYKATKELVCEASDIDTFGSGVIAFKSEKTGKIAVFQGTNTEQDNEGEVLCWHFSPTGSTLSTCPELSGWKLVVLND